MTNVPRRHSNNRTIEPSNNRTITLTPKNLFTRTSVFNFGKTAACNIDKIMTKFLVPLLFLLCLLTSCHVQTNEASEEMRTLTENIASKGIETVNTNLSISVGQLVVTGGADQLMEGEFTYQQADWKPEIDFRQDGTAGELSIKQPNLGENLNINFGNDNNNQWLVRLNDQVLQDLNCKIGAGKTELDLRGLSLRSVHIDAGVGQHDVNLTDCSVPELLINAGIGEISVDLTGRWKNDLQGEINGGIGTLNLILPRDVGVRLEVQGGLGAVDVPTDFRRDGQVYTSARYDEDSHHLNLDVKAGLGSIEVRVAE